METEYIIQTPLNNLSMQIIYKQVAATWGCFA